MSGTERSWAWRSAATRTGTTKARSAAKIRHHSEPHSHAEIVDALRECEAVIAGGMGRWAAEELRGNGIEPYLTRSDCTPEQAIALYVAGKLKPAHAARHPVSERKLQG